MLLRVALVVFGLVALTACPPAKEDCANGKDDDGNGKTDCDDPACSASKACGGPAGEGEGEGAVAEGEGEGNVGEGEGEGAGEGEGEGAVGEGEGEGGEGEGEGAAGEGEGEGTVADCGDGVDNDGDGLVDAADPGCINGVPLGEGNDDQCNDGIDNDFDGQVDGADPQCGSVGHEADATSLPNITVESRIDLVFTEADATTPTADGNPIVDTVNVGPFDDEFLEGCYTGTGDRRRIEFNAIIRNSGARDLIVGDPQNHQPLWNNNNPLQEFLFEGWLRFEVREKLTGNVVASGHKGSFCMLDLVPPDNNPNAPGQFFDCGSGQGISVGFADEYSIGLKCEFVDVTGVPPGDYTLHIDADFTHQLPESDYTDNGADIDFTLN